MTLSRTTTFRRLRRLSVLGIAAVGVSICLGACSPLSIAQHKWESRLDAASGVESASWTYRNNWPSSPSRYSAKLQLSPNFTDADAREIARLSCDGAPRLDEVTAHASSAENTWDATLYGLDSSCFDPEQLTRFSSVLDAVKAATPALTGEIVVHGSAPSDADEQGNGANDASTLRLTAETTSPETLFSLLREVHSRTDGAPIEFEGSVDDDGSTITNFGTLITVRLPAAFDLAPALPILEHAYALDHRGITFTSEGIAVSPATVAMINEAATLEVQAESARAGIPFTLLAPGGASTDEQQSEAYGALTQALAAIPGISGVELPSRSGGAETKVRATSDEAIAKALELIGSNEKINAEFYIEGPQDTLFVRVMRNSGNNPGMLEAFQQMLEARQSIPHTEFVALIVYADSINMRFDLAAEAAESDVTYARAELLQMLESSPIDGVSLHPPYPAPWEDLGS